MKIKHIIIKQLFCLTILILIASCSKSGDTGTTPTPTPTPTPTVEDPIVFSIDIDPGTSVYPALGATQDAKITLSSKMPAAGISIDVIVKKDLDNSIVSSNTYTSSITPFTATISNLSPGVLCTANFTVTSKSTLSNSVNKSFKLARK